MPLKFQRNFTYFSVALFTRIKKHVYTDDQGWKKISERVRIHVFVKRVEIRPLKACTWGSNIKINVCHIYRHSSSYKHNYQVSRRGLLGCDTVY